jgi:predicted enzyme related to lactoylglutathione lyase
MCRSSMNEITNERTAITPVIQVKRLGIVMINTSDVEHSARFYKEMLGFTESEEQMLEPGVTLQAGDFQIYISDGRAAATREPASVPDIGLALIVPGVKESYEQVRAAEGRIIAPYEAASEYFASFSIADPDGNEIAIWGKA